MKILNTYTLGLPKQDSEPVLYTYVLAEGGDGSQAVYVGIGDPEWIAAHGTKLNFKQAINYYPLLQEKDYRV